MNFIHGPNNRFRIKTPDARSHCFKLNMKSMQLNTTHQLSNVMVGTSDSTNNLIVGSYWEFLGSYLIMLQIKVVTSSFKIKHEMQEM